MKLKAGIPAVSKPVLGEAPKVRKEKPEDPKEQRRRWERLAEESGYDVQIVLELMSGAFNELGGVEMGTALGRLKYAKEVLWTWFIIVGRAIRAAGDDYNKD